ncbi:MAG: hypothetical protein IJ801_08845 [Lachnospiraceae bacterium]|nr:hypothetical protein [Lachnospiraceae bacterium]
MNKLRRVVAMLTVFLIVGLIIGTLICAFTGSKYFMGMLFLTLAVPVVLWVFMWFTNLVSGQSQEEQNEDKEQQE